MRLPALRALALSSLALSPLLLEAQEKPAEGPRFAAPRRLMAGKDYLGARRPYPSPVVHDFDGDGRGDIVTGDLFGKLTGAPRVSPADGPAKLGQDRPLKGRDGKTLDFNNW